METSQQFRRPLQVVHTIELHFSSRNAAQQDPTGTALSFRAVMRARELQRLSQVTDFRVHRTSANTADCWPVLRHDEGNPEFAHAEVRLELKDICSCFGLANFPPKAEG